MDGDHLVVKCAITNGDKTVETPALIDCGATGFAFIDEEFVRQHNLPTYQLRTPRALEVIDGRPIASGDITHMVKIPIAIGGHYETLPAFVTKLGHYRLVLGIPWMKRHDITINFATSTLSFASSHCKQHCLRSPRACIPVKANERPPGKPNICAISATAFRRLVSNRKGRYGKGYAFALSLYEINHAIRTFDKDPGLKEMVPAIFHEYLHLFEEAPANKLPLHRPYDHKIPLKPGFTPPYGPLYSLSLEELKTLKAWLEENLAKGFIRASSSPSAAPVLFIKKKDGSLRLCVDYRGLNEGTIKDRYPLPLIHETLMQLQKAKIYTTLDIRNAYNLLRIVEGDEWKTAFRTRYGSFESLVMNFGLTGAPATWQRFINDVLREFLDVCATAYLDDILIYSETMEEHVIHVRRILQALAKAGLHLKPEKCKFFQQEVGYLGLLISTNGIRMEPGKISAVLEWPTPRNVKDVRAFVGFANFYRRFIRNYSGIVTPLTRLTGKDIPFEWGQQCQEAFDQLKHAFTSAPILKHFDHTKPVLVETDASDYVSAGVLSQRDDDGVLHPVAFYSKKHSPAECNYEIYDKELMAIIRAFEEWRPELEGAEHPVQVLTDHKNLEYFMTTKNLNRRQARWAEYLSRFDFKIVYRPGTAGGKPDALTRRSGDLPEEGDERLMQQQKALLKPHNLPPQLQIFANGLPDDDAPTLDALFVEAYDADPFPAEVIHMLQQGERHSRKITLAECGMDGDRLTYRNRLYVPEYDPLRLRLIQQHHDTPAAGHPGRSKTLELLQRGYYWKNMRDSVMQYIRNCHICQRSRTSRHAPYGVLRPMPIPVHPWQDISMDFVTGLPWSEGFDAIWVVVDRLTKQRHLIPCTTNIDSAGLADLFIREVFRLHGLPDTIVSDRGPQFAAGFWKRLCARLGVQPKLSTPFHPQTDGQTERINATMEQYLRNYVTYLQDDWSKWLPLAEFAANNQTNESTTVSPFFANIGRNPRWQVDASAPLPNDQADIRARTVAHALTDIHDYVRTALVDAQQRYQDNADLRRLPAPRFLPGDRVWLNTRNMRTRRPSRKLDSPRAGPFLVLADPNLKTPYAVRLELPDSMHIHPVRHVSELEPAANDPLPGQQQPPPPPIEVDGEDEWAVDEILDSRMFRRKLQYKVKWTGYDELDWYDANLMNGLQAVDEFHRRYPHKPGPLPEDAE